MPSPCAVRLSGRVALVQGKHKRRGALAAFTLAALLALMGTAGSAASYQVQYCSQIPIVGGIPPWGFNTGAPISEATGSYALARC